MVLIFIGIGIVLLIVCSILGLSWYIAGRLLNRKSSTRFNIDVVSIDTQTIRLKRTKNTWLPGIFGVTGKNGQAIIGPVIEGDDESVTRQIIQQEGVIVPQEKVAWNTTIYGGRFKDQLPLTINKISFPAPPGAMPAWHVAGGTTWAILIHGSTATQEQGLRTFPTLVESGCSILDIAYRNDRGAPSSSDGLSHSGDTEWEDLEAGVKYALEQGAQRIILIGWSMGALIALTFLSRSFYADQVHALVFDSPILSWKATVRFLVKNNRLPGIIAVVTALIIALRTGVKFSALDQLQQPLKPVPILLFHGINDKTAPIGISDSYVEKHPSIIYHRIADADHTQCWNVNGEYYTLQLRSFLSDVNAVTEVGLD